MLIEPQSEIVIKFRDGSFMNCIVDKWTTKESVVYLNDDNREMVVIQDTDEDVMMIRFLNKTYYNRVVSNANSDIPKDRDLAMRVKSGEQIKITSDNFDLENEKSVQSSTEELLNSTKSTILAEEFELLRQQPMTVDNLSEMARLKDELNKLEREELLNKFKSHEIGEVKETKYVIPGTNVASTGSTKYPAQKTGTKNNAISQQLRQVLSEKHSKNR